MKVFLRMAVCVGTATVMGFILSGFASSWFAGQADVIQLSRWLVYETRRTEALRHRAEMIAQAQDVRGEIIATVVAGRLSLRQAMAQVQRANELVENLDEDLVGRYWTPTDPEGVARQVLAWVDAAATLSPSSETSCILATLDDEFQEMFGSPRNAEELPSVTVE